MGQARRAGATWLRSADGQEFRLHGDPFICFSYQTGPRIIISSLLTRQEHSIIVFTVRKYHFV